MRCRLGIFTLLCQHGQRRRLLAIDKLGTSEKRQVLQLIDAYIERGQLTSKVQGRSAG